MLHWLIIVQFIHKFVKRNVFYAKVFQNIMPLANFFIVAVKFSSDNQTQSSSTIK